MDKYTEGEVIFSSGSTNIQFAKRKDDGKQFVIKKPADSYQALSSVESFKKDFQFTSMLHNSYPNHFVHMVECLEQNNGSIYLVEEMEGISLQKSLQTDGVYSVEKFVDTACMMSKCLYYSHKTQIFHRDIKLGNFITSGEKVKLIDFGISVTVTRKSPSVSCTAPTGTISYMSPEQTGRIHKNADFRSDIYSLGICFYELLTGNVPFKGDKLAIVHAHISKKLPVIQNIPDIINKIIQKMCAKSPSERYTSAYGVMKDLEFVKENISNLKDFELGKYDLKLFQIPNKLYGREEEIKILKQSINNLSKNSMCLVSGYSGMGKSKLVEELLKDQNMNLLMAYGKFDQFNRLTPYSAFISTMKSLVNRVLSESTNEKRKNFEQLLRLELGEKFGSTLHTILPEIEILIGKQKLVESLNTAKETQERLFDSFLKFYNCFTGENTLVLVLDDLQWCDAASFQFLEKLLSLKNQKVFIIGAYRDNEVGENHPLMNILNENKNMTNINLQPLKLEHLNEMVAETLNSNEERTIKLSELIYKKTNGNPFFSREFINTLYQEELLIYENEIWNWNIEKVEKMNFSSNVIDFMIKNLKKKPKNMQKLLNRASCIGNTFKIEELKWIWDEKTKIEQELIEPVSEGWIHQINSNEYQFFHDRLQQSSYELFDEKEIQKIHLIIGKILLKQFMKKNSIEQNIFNVINHLNISKSLFENQNELLKLNLIAAKKSLENSAFSASLKFSNNSIELLPKDAWNIEYKLAFESHSIHAETCYANSILDESEKYYNLTLENAVGRFDKLTIIAQFVKMLSLTNKKEKAYDLLVVAFKMFDLTKNIPFEDIQGSLYWTMNLKKKISIEIQQIGDYSKILSLKKCNDRELILFLTMMCEAMDVLVLANNANPIIIISNSLACLYLYLTEGLANNAPIGIGFAGWIYSFFFREKDGYALSSIAEKLYSKDKNPNYNVVSVHNVIGVGYLTGGTLKEILYHLESASRLAVIHGEYVFGAYASLHSSQTSAANGGDNFEKLISTTKKKQNWLIQIKNMFNVDFLEILINYLSDLCGISDYNPNLSIPNFTTFKHADCFKPTFEGMLQFHKGNYEKAMKIFDTAESVGDNGKGLPDYYERKFYHCLTLIIHLKKNPNNSEVLERIKVLLEEQKLFGELGPDFLGPKYKLLDLMFQTTFKNVNKMKILGSLEDLYESTNENGLFVLSAVISELILQFCDENGLPKSLCKLYYSNTFKIWSSLSAKRKEEQLRKKYFRYSISIRKNSESSGSSSNTTLTTSTVSDSDSSSTHIVRESLDMMSIIKASQALSVELTTSNLISKVLSIIIENTGAQSGLLFLNDSRGEILEFSMKNGKKQKISKRVDSISENEMYCSLLLSLSKSMKKTIVINDVEESQYSKNPYLKKEGIKSICVHPIVKGKKFIGTIYLEHRSLEGAFDESRKEILEHISTQLAISYENAKLYEDMNSLNQSYERFLPKEFLEQLGKGDVRNIKIGDAASKKICVLFSDIRSFTDITEKMNPEESFSFVNGILSYLAPIISKHNGFIDKFFGDCIMALFPHEVDDSIKCGYEMLSALDEYNKNYRKNLDLVKIGIGIHYGDSMIGTIGTENRIDATVISDTVNTASRVESLTKTLGATFVVTESVIQNSKLNNKNRYIGKYLLKGKKISMSLFHMIDENSKVNIEKFTEGIHFFESGNFKESEKIFHSLNDKTSKYLEKVAKHFRNYQFDNSWSGEIKIDKDGNLVELENKLLFGDVIQNLKENEIENVLNKISNEGMVKEMLTSWLQKHPQHVKNVLNQ